MWKSAIQNRGSCEGVKLIDLWIRLALADYDIIIQYVKCIDTVIADAMSRLNLKLVEIYGERKLSISGDYNNHTKLSDNEFNQLKQYMLEFNKQSQKIRNDLKILIMKWI